MKRKTHLTDRPLTRSSGVLLHLTSLPSPYGIGDLGPAAHRWVNMLATARQRWWQVLPLGPPGAGDSPYQCFSAFAGNPLLVSPDVLVEQGLIDRSDASAAKLPAGRVDHARAALAKTDLLARAWGRFSMAGGAGRRLTNAFKDFQDRHAAAWLNDFALFMALRDAHHATEWTDWPDDLARRRTGAIATATRDLAGPIARHKFSQFLFFDQLAALRRHARSANVGLIGDLPIFVSHNGADVWTNPHLFELDRHLRPKAVAGCPPDAFTCDGQRWGNPLYDWAAMKRENYRWWVDRVRAALDQSDLVRLDHFRGFEAYWRIPATHPTARNGRWVTGPGASLFQALRDELGGLPLIAEDLGVITPKVEALRDAFGLPGMRVGQFGFGDDPANPHLPHNYARNGVAYTGTHDNDTTAGWFASLTPTQRSHVRAYAGETVSRKSAAPALTRLVWSSVADLAIVPLQDVLGLPGSTRMNTPGTATGNWAWRLESFAGVESGLGRLAELTTLYGRAE